MALSLLVMSCATMQASGPELLGRAAKAMGGADTLAGVKKNGLTPVKFAGGHGSIADYAPLAALEGK